MRAIVLVIPLVLLSASGPQAQTEKPPDAKTSAKSARLPLDHLRAARTTLDAIDAAMLKAEAAEKVKDLKTRLGTLEDSYVSHGSKRMTSEQTASGSTRVRIGQQGTWSSQVPDIDRILGELLEPRGSVARDADHDHAIKRQLTTVRTHLTAFAKGASGTSGPPR